MQRPSAPRPRPGVVLLLALFFGTSTFLGTSAMSPAAAAQAPRGGEEAAREDGTERSLSLRSTEIIDFDCSSTIGRHRITLFGNGTVRVKDYARGWTDSRTGEQRDDLSAEGLGVAPPQPRERSTLALGELSPEVFQETLDRLHRIDLSEAEASYGGLAGGDWIDTCRLTVALPGRTSTSVGFGRWDSLDLEVSRAVRLAEGLEIWTEPLEAAGTALDREYVPRRGDRVVRGDGQVFEILGLTTDRRGVELRGRRIPLTVFISLDELRRNYRPSAQESDGGFEP